MARSQPTKALTRALLWILLNSIGGIVGVTAAAIVDSFSPLLPFTARDFAALQLQEGIASGLPIAFFQWLLLRNIMKRAGLWMLATPLGFSLGLFVGNALPAILPTLRGSLRAPTFAIFTGMGVGLFQWMAIARHVRGAKIWAVTSAMSWMIVLMSPVILPAMVITGPGLPYGVLTAYLFASGGVPSSTHRSLHAPSRNAGR